MDTSSSTLARLSISLPAELMAQLDAMVAERGLPSRSQMIAELIRHELAEHSEGVTGAVLAGTITLIYRAERGRVRQARTGHGLGGARRHRVFSRRGASDRHAGILQTMLFVFDRHKPAPRGAVNGPGARAAEARAAASRQPATIALDSTAPIIETIVL